MKTKNTAILISIIALGSLSASASTITISGSDFNNINLVASYNGTYDPSGGGQMDLSYAGDDDAVVGVKGPLGTLDHLSMSFDYSNPVGTGNAPFAAFGVSVDGLWTGSLYQYNIISMSGNQLNGTSLVHVWDWNLNGGAGGDVDGFGQSDHKTLNDVLAANNGFNGLPYGDLRVMRAYAYIGDTGGPSSGSVDITSITVTSVPDVTSTLSLLGMGFGALVTLRRRMAK